MVEKLLQEVCGQVALRITRGQIAIGSCFALNVVPARLRQLRLWSTQSRQAVLGRGGVSSYAPLWPLVSASCQWR